MNESSGDTRLDRRLDWARAALADGDLAAACDILQQTVAEAPKWAAAWFLLAQAQERADLLPAALAAFAQAAAHDANGVLGADLDLARLGAASAATSQNHAYVTALFDEYAPRFDKHLREGLGYRGPEILLKAVSRACDENGRPASFSHMIDRGCGTGLAAEVFADTSQRISGVDLSPRMVALAGAKSLYAVLEAGELVAFLEKQPVASADLVLAADVLVYIGDLVPVFIASARTLESGGLLAVTVQASADADVVIGTDKRFAHSEGYLRRITTAAGLELLQLEPAVTRREGDRAVEGLVLVAAKP
ncbi:MAG: class I SAM-dependent DNA methyltransferase [Bosea sp. (in: a-proteobacteria)]